MKEIDKQPYKGVRDFMPQDMTVQNHIFSIWRDICTKYGYEEYNASVLEPAELYKAKSGEEIVNEQTYTFTDRGDREVTLRPEMTPTLARMISAHKRELIFPVRWFSIPNVFRYEQPQRGRLREHWQLNVDIMGIKSSSAEIEVINMAYDITKAYGLKDIDFEIRLNNRKITNYIFTTYLSLNEDQSHKLGKIIDRRQKMDSESFEMSCKDILQDEEKVQKLRLILNSKNFQEFASHFKATEQEESGFSEIRQVIEGLSALNINNVRFDQTLMRGFDYYTGTVFEIFDLNPSNRRSVFGGGRYDELGKIFGEESVPAFGFGAGDVIARDLLETYSMIPKHNKENTVSIVSVSNEVIPYCFELAQRLRQSNINIVIDFSDKKIGDKISSAFKRGIRKCITIGDNEVKSGILPVKDLSLNKEEKISEDQITNYLLNKI